MIKQNRKRGQRMSVIKKIIIDYRVFLIERQSSFPKAIRYRPLASTNVFKLQGEDRESFEAIPSVLPSCK